MSRTRAALMTVPTIVNNANILHRQRIVGHDAVRMDPSLWSRPLALEGAAEKKGERGEKGETGVVEAAADTAAEEDTTGHVIYEMEVMKVMPDHKTHKKVIIDTTSGRLTFYHVKKQKNLIRASSEVMSVVKSNRKAKELSVNWLRREDPEKFVFHSKAERDLFYAAVYKARSESMAPPEEVSLYILTWNMGNAAAPPNISSALPLGYDIYVVCVQECEHTPADSSSTCEAEWFEQVRTQLGEEYVQLTSITLLYIRMLVVVRRDVYFHIKDVKRSSVPTGIAGAYRCHSLLLHYNYFLRCSLLTIFGE